jgi:hypothetical protein
VDTTPTTVETAASAVVPAGRTGGLSAEARAAVEEGIPAETRRGYAGDWARFTTWCANTGHPALPATGDTLTEYLTHLKGEDKSPSTMDRALASIAVAHAAADLPKPSTVGARRVLKGHEAERKKSRDPRRRPRRVLPGVENADEGGVHGADEMCRRRPASMGAGGAVVGKVSFSSARCRLSCDSEP